MEAGSGASARKRFAPASLKISPLEHRWQQGPEAPTIRNDDAYRRRIKEFIRAGASLAPSARRTSFSSSKSVILADPVAAQFGAADSVFAAISRKPPRRDSNAVACVIISGPLPMPCS